MSEFVIWIKKKYWRWLFKNKPFQDFSFKPLDCSLCMTHHTLLAYLLIMGEFTIINYMVVCLLSFLSSNITALLVMVKETLIKIEGRLYNLLNKI